MLELLALNEAVAIITLTILRVTAVVLLADAVGVIRLILGGDLTLIMRAMPLQVEFMGQRLSGNLVRLYP